MLIDTKKPGSLFFHDALDMIVDTKGANPKSAGGLFHIHLHLLCHNRRVSRHSARTLALCTQTCTLQQKEQKKKKKNLLIVTEIEAVMPETKQGCALQITDLSHLVAHVKSSCKYKEQFQKCRFLFSYFCYNVHMGNLIVA